MIRLPVEPRLVDPTTAVRASYLTGEQADCLQRGLDTEWLAAASTDFDTFVRDRVGVRTRWDVPSTALWFELAAGLVRAGALGLEHVPLTCGPDNEPSQKVILANGGVPLGPVGQDETADLRFRIDLPATSDSSA